MMQIPGMPCRARVGIVQVVVFLAVSLSRIVAAQDIPTAAAPGAANGNDGATLPLRFSVSFDPSITTGSFTGRVYVMLSSVAHEPRFGPAWFGTQPFYARDVKDWQPDRPLLFDDRAIGFPGKLSELKTGAYTCQAVMRINPDSPEIGTGEGSAYSAPQSQTLNADTSGAVFLRIKQVVTARPLKENDRVKLVELHSKLLSDFHHRDITMRAAIVFPAGYEADAATRYPAMYWIGGFGSDHRGVYGMLRSWDNTGMGDHIVRVVLDPSCYGGHHVFADSANNGPRGQALVEEFIPYLEKTYRLVASPTARFVSGHSSGGWSSLWLQTTYPDFFGGTWSIAPDPVDFRDFQRIDIYKPGANTFVDETGARRPVGRAGDHILGFYDDFTKMENVIGEGGQLRSFDWVFSPRGADGMPLPMYDHASGAVNPAVAEAWRKYDIRLNLETNWKTLGPKLAGKLHVFVGDMDTFYLEGAVRLLKQSLADLKSDAVVEVVPNRDHSSIASPDLRRRIDGELLEVFNKAHPEFAKPLDPAKPSDSQPDGG